MPELAAKMAQLDVVIDPSSLSRWLIRHGFRYKKNCWRRNKIAPK
jgi:transposase